MQDQFSAHLAAIEAALQGRPLPTITGAMLGSLIQSAAPELDFRALVGIPKGPGALKEFVASHLSGLLERTGNQGDDIIYRIKGHEITDAESVDIWKNFVSPSSPRHLVLERGRQRLVSRSAAASLDSDEVEIAKASEAEHDAIRASFMASLPPHEASEVAERVPQDAIFPVWISELRTHVPDVIRKWGVHRKDRLFNLFCERVDALKLDAALRDKVIAQIKASQHAAYARQKDEKASNKDGRTSDRWIGNEHASDAVAVTARSLAHVAVDLMSYDDLRSLKLPLGVMLDAFSKRR